MTGNLTMRLRSMLSSAAIRFAPNLWKQRLRDKALREHLTQDYPFDPESRLIRTLLQRHDAFFDVGANAGFYSIMAEDIVGEGNLFLFEPLPVLHRTLELLFRNSHVSRFAVSDSSATTTLRIPFLNGARFDTRASVVPDFVEPDQTGYDELEVGTISIDEFVQNTDIRRVRFIKIDVEGHELAVLEGAKHTIARHHPLLLVEIEQRHHKQPMHEIFTEMKLKGYAGFFLEPRNWKLLPVELFNTKEHQRMEDLRKLRYKDYVNNFFFCHNSEVEGCQERIQALMNVENPIGLSQR